jgi:hypothetical protein
MRALIHTAYALVLAATLAAGATVGVSACAPKCQGCGVAHPEEPVTDAEAVTACASAGAKMEQLHCREARPDYSEWCTYEIAHGVPLRPVCVSKVTDCSQVDGVCR